MWSTILTRLAAVLMGFGFAALSAQAQPLATVAALPVDPAALASPCGVALVRGFESAPVLSAPGQAATTE